MKPKKCKTLLASLFITIFCCALNVNAEDNIYLFAFYTGEADNTAGMRVAWSKDALHYEPISGHHAFLRCDFGGGGGGKQLRAPFIMQDNEGYWHCLWTLGDDYYLIAHAKSKDLFTWERHHYVPIMEKLGGKNCLAPEMVYDEQSKQFLIFWSSEVGKTGPRLYSTTTKDFSKYEPAKLLYDPGHDVLDPTIRKVDDKYYLFYRQKTGDEKKNKLSIAVTDKTEGPYKHLRDAEFEMDLIGPAVLRMDDGNYLIYFESRTNNRVEALKTKDFVNWENVTEKITFPEKARQGSVARSTMKTVDAMNKETHEGFQRYLANISFDKPMEAEKIEGEVTATLTVDASKVKKISDEFIGVFFEDINYSADGGLYAELVQNRGFEYNHEIRWGWNALSYWELVKPEGTEGSVEAKSDNPLHTNNPHYAVITGDKGISFVNEGFDGIVLKKGDLYDFSVFARSDSDMKIKARLTTKDGKPLGESETFTISKDWKKFEAAIKAAADCDEARLAVVVESKGSVAVDMVSLFPQKTFKNRKNGLRADLAQAIADLNPKFMRFPGGCLVHGQGLGNIYHWKRTIGPLEERVPQRNIWGYHQSAGLGYFEYFQFCSDLGIEPVPVVAAGVCCQNSHRVGAAGIPLEEMPAYVQDVLDLIEYANGPAESTWGKKRAEAGHPEPFNLKYLGIGNEDMITDVFEERYRMICDAVREKHPKIILIGTVGTHFEGTDYREGWKLAEKMKLPLVDEHYYVNPGWFINNQDFYDNYDRNGSKVYLGEYASWGNVLYNALAEAAYMTGMERNGDVVHMASYAPLLAKKDQTQWKTDLIFFSNTDIKLTPNYYVQKMFGHNSGQEYVSNSLRLSKDTTDFMKRVAASVVKDKESGDLIVKLVNILPVSVKTDIALENTDKIATKGVAHVLSGNPNEDTQVPETNMLTVGKNFSYKLKPHSLSVIRIQTK